MINLLVDALIKFVGPWQTNRQLDIQTRQAAGQATQAEVQKGNLEVNRKRLDFERRQQLRQLVVQADGVATQKASVQLQRERFEHDKQQQREAVEERRRLQQEAAADRLKEIFRAREVGVIFENWPLRMSPVQYLPTSSGHEPKPIKIIVAPPDWEPPIADAEAGATAHSATFALRKAVEEHLRPFLRRHYPLMDPQRPAELLGGAWQGKRLRGESAMVALFNLLGSEPTLVLETERVGQDLSLRIGYWGLGQSGYCFYEVDRIPYDRMAAAIAREGAKRWRASREQLRAAGVSEEEITRYGGIAAANIRVLEAEERLAAAGVPVDQFAFFRISEADHNAAAEAVAACHCLIASCVTDVYHLVHYDTPPLLPNVMLELIANLPVEWASSLVAEVVQSFRGVYAMLAGDRPAWRPELLLDLAESLVGLPDAGLAREEVHASLNSWLSLHGVISESGNGNRSEWLLAMRAVAQENDRAYLERLAHALEAVGESETADELQKLISALPQHDLPASGAGREMSVSAPSRELAVPEDTNPTHGAIARGREERAGAAAQDSIGNSVQAVQRYRRNSLWLDECVRKVLRRYRPDQSRKSYSLQDYKTEVQGVFLAPDLPFSLNFHFATIKESPPLSSAIGGLYNAGLRDCVRPQGAVCLFYADGAKIWFAGGAELQSFGYQDLARISLGADFVDGLVMIGEKPMKFRLDGYFSRRVLRRWMTIAAAVGAAVCAAPSHAWREPSIKELYALLQGYLRQDVRFSGAGLPLIGDAAAYAAAVDADYVSAKIVLSSAGLSSIGSAAAAARVPTEVLRTLDSMWRTSGNGPLVERRWVRSDHLGITKHGKACSSTETWLELRLNKLRLGVS